MQSSAKHGWIKRYGQAMDLLAALCILVTGVALVYLTVIFGWLVYGRYVLNATPTWVEQAALLLVVFIGFLGAAVGVHQKTHLSVTYFVDLFPPAIKRILLVITHLMMGAFGAVMMIYSYDLVVFKWGSQIPLIDLPEGLRAVPIMLSGALVLLFTVGHLLDLDRETGPKEEETQVGSL